MVISGELILLSYLCLLYFTVRDYFLGLCSQEPAESLPYEFSLVLIQHLSVTHIRINYRILIIPVFIRGSLGQPHLY